MDNLPCSDWLMRFQAVQAVSAVQPWLPKVAIANPPYGSTRHNIYPNFALAYCWCKDGQSFSRTQRPKNAPDGEVLFTELCVRYLQPGEVAVLLLPNGVLSGERHHYARHWLGEQAQVVASIQLPDTVWKVECRLGLITSILVLRRDPDPIKADYSIFMVVCETCGYDSRCRRLYKRNPVGKRTEEIDDEVGAIAPAFCQFLNEGSGLV